MQKETPVEARERVAPELAFTTQPFFKQPIQLLQREYMIYIISSGLSSKSPTILVMPESKIRNRVHSTPPDAISKAANYSIRKIFLNFAARHRNTTTLCVLLFVCRRAIPRTARADHFTNHTDMKLQTPVDLPECPFSLTPHTHIMAVGSCFADEMGRRLGECMPCGHAQVNPWGALYNPHSILNCLKWLTVKGDAPHDDHFFEGRDGMWHHRMCSTTLSGATFDECRKKVEHATDKAIRMWEAADVLIVTWSTDHVYRLTAGDRSIVANCHKQPAGDFCEETLPTDRIVEEWSGWLDALERDSHRPRHVVFTLSPYRYAKHGMHESMLSKARLACAMDALCRTHGAAVYFPAYEILMDELRDYRFYAADMLHPSEVAVDYIWQRFREWAFTSALDNYATDCQRLRRDFAHRFLHPDSPAAQKFLRDRETRRLAFCRKYGETLLPALNDTTSTHNQTHEPQVASERNGKTDA